MYSFNVVHFIIKTTFYQLLKVTKTGGLCLDENGHDQQTHVILADDNSSERGCLEECRRLKTDDQYPITACEYSSQTRSCFYHTQPVSRGNNDYGHTCWLFHEAGQQNILHCDSFNEYIS